MPAIKNFLKNSLFLKLNYTPKVEKFLENKKLNQKYLHKKSITLDGYQVELSANIGTPDDVDSVVANGGEGVGLYRTEFLYMTRSSFPTEDEQYQTYKTV